ncbi:hypothetical protein XENTR_v10022563 [Xenopus tropicalis]|nr:hypothetical protein XENTR_v10022563 [Xenopus tropicalis]
MSAWGSLYVFASILCCIVVRAQQAAQLCDQPELQNGEFRYWYSFPLSTFRAIEYNCYEHYVPLNKTNDNDTYGVARCTENGWDPRAKCLGKPCLEALAVENARIIEEKYNYRDGENVKYVCNTGYRMAGNGEAQCLNGQWMDIPTCISTFCGPAPTVGNASAHSQKDIYQSSEKVVYECDGGFVFHKSNEALCKNGQWIEIPECGKEGESCGPPPAVQFGDLLSETQAVNPHGTALSYKCHHLFKLEGTGQVTCRNGKWVDPPVCLEPCIVLDEHMKANNISLKWVEVNTLSARHGDWIGFRCLDGYGISDEALLRVQCIKGTIDYPTCTLELCIILEQHMKANNIKLKWLDLNSLVAHRWVEFKCLDGYKIFKGKQLRVQCINGAIIYPNCTKVEPCTIAAKDMEENNIRLMWKDSSKLYSTHGDTIEFTCLDGYRISDSKSMRTKCNRGVVSYPNCTKQG